MTVRFYMTRSLNENSTLSCEREYVCRVMSAERRLLNNAHSSTVEWTLSVEPLSMWCLGLKNVIFLSISFKWIRWPMLEGPLFASAFDKHMTCQTNAAGQKQMVIFFILFSVLFKTVSTRVFILFIYLFFSISQPRLYHCKSQRKLICLLTLTVT